MTPRSSPDVKSIFGHALELTDPTRRSAYLDEACADAPAIRAEVEELLAMHEHAGGFLRRPAVVAPELTGVYEPPSPLVGTLIAGRYKLLEEIGDGGMGTVWMAEQKEPVKRLVAVKLIKAGMDSKAVLARFEAERQALAMMDHPNIAKVHDAGTDDTGRPYFVMELVKGLPLTEYCDVRKLSVNERLDLFVQICSAVQHAHQKAIIHRDLKPTNVLVTEHDGKPVPKVIDFGLAKALNSSQMLTDRTLHTAYGTVVGTPLYMAPEQVGINALDVDTRTDIYSLGVILYELLTGTTPLEKAKFKEAAWEEVKRLIREEEPPRPSTRLSSDKTLPSLAASRQVDATKLPGLVRGELDWIVMKALEKDRARRYDTANGLARDVQRYLAGDAVEACPPTLGYRLKKLYRRNRAAKLVGSTIAAVLLLATGVSLAFGIVARNAERLAEQERAESDRQRDAAVLAEEHARQRGEEATSAKNRLKVSLYAADMKLVATAWETGDIARARALLDRNIPQPGEDDLRGFEWHYWNRRSDESRSTVPLEVHNSTVRFERERIAFNASGPLLAAITHDGPQAYVLLWNTTTGRMIRQLKGPEDRRFQLANYTWSRPIVWSADGSRLAVAFTRMDSTVFDIWIWEGGKGGWEGSETPRLVRMLTVPGFRGWLTLNPKGSQLAVIATRFKPELAEEPILTSFQHTLLVWDIDTDNPPRTIATDKRLHGLAFTPDDRLHSFELMRPLGDKHPESVKNWSTRLRSWDPATGEPVPTADLAVQGQIHDVDFTPDGQHVAGRVFHGGNRYELKVWAIDLAQKSVRELMTKTLEGNSRAWIALSPDGSQLVTFGQNELLRIWDVAAGEVRSAFRGHSGQVSAACIDPGSNHLISVDSKQILKRWEMHSRSATLSSTSKVATTRFDLRTKPTVVQIIGTEDQEITQIKSEYEVTSAKFSTDLRRFVIVEQDKRDNTEFARMVVWEFDDWKPRLLRVFPWKMMETSSETFSVLDANLEENGRFVLTHIRRVVRNSAVGLPPQFRETYPVEYMVHEVDSGIESAKIRIASEVALQHSFSDLDPTGNRNSTVDVGQTCRCCSDVK